MTSYRDAIRTAAVYLDAVGLNGWASTVRGAATPAEGENACALAISHVHSAIHVLRAMRADARVCESTLLALIDAKSWCRDSQEASRVDA